MASTDVIQTTVTTTNVPANNDNDIAIKARPKLSSPLAADTPTPPASNSSVACHSISDIDTCNAINSGSETCKEESRKNADATSKSQQASDKQEQSTSVGTKDTKSTPQITDTNNNAKTKSIRRLAAHRPEPLKLIPTPMKLKTEKSINNECSATTLATTSSSLSSSSAPATTTISSTATANGSNRVKLVGDKPLDLSVRTGDNVPLSALAKLGFPTLGSGSGSTTTTTTASNLFSSVGSSGTIGTTPSCGQQSTLETPRIVWQDNESLLKNQTNHNSHHNHHHQHQQWFNSTSSRSRHQSTNRFSAMFGTPSTSTPPLTPNTPLTASQQLNSSGNLSSLSCFLAQLSPHSLSASSPLLPQLSATSSNSCESALSSAGSTCSASRVGFSCSKEGVAALGALNSPLGVSSSHLLQLHQHQHQLHHQSHHSLRDLPQLHLTNQHHNQQHPQHLSTSSSSLAGLLTPSYFRHYELASCLPSPLFATTASSSGSATGSAKAPGDGGAGRVVAGAFFAPSDPLPAVFQDINHHFSISKKTKSPSTQSSSLLPPTTVQSTIANLHNIHLSSPTELSGSLMTPTVVGVPTTRSTTTTTSNDCAASATTQTNCQQSLDTPKIEQHNNSFSLALASPLKLQAPTLAPVSPVTSYTSQASNESNRVAPSSRATTPPPLTSQQQQQLASLVTSAKHKQQPPSSIQDIEMDVDVDEIADDAAAQAEIKLVLERNEPAEDSIDVDISSVHQQRATSASASTNCLHTVTETGISNQPVMTTSPNQHHQQQTETTIQPLNHQLQRSASTVPLIYVSKQQHHQHQQQQQQQQQPEVHVIPTSCQHQQLQLHLSGSSWNSSNAQSSTSCGCCCFSCNSLINFNQLNQFCPQQQQLQQHVVNSDAQHNVTDVPNNFHTTVNESRQYRCARLDSCSAPPPQLPHSGRATPIRANLNSSGQSIVNYQHNQKQQLDVGSRVLPTSASNSNCSYTCSCNDELESLGTCGLPSSSSNCALYCAPSSSPTINTPTAYASNSMSCLQASGIQNVGLHRHHHSQNQDLQRLQPVMPTSERHFVASNCISPRRPLVASTGNLALPVRRSQVQPNCQQQLLQLHNHSASQLLAIPTTTTTTTATTTASQSLCVPRSSSDDCSLFNPIGNQNRSASATFLARHHTNITNRRPRPLSSSSLTSPTNSASGNNLFMSSSRKYRCFQCNKSFARSDMLTRHQRLHSGIRPFRCNQCKQEFSRSDHLSTHMRTHTGEKPYRCKLCSYVACRKDMITRHMKVHVGMTKQQTQHQLQQLHNNNNTNNHNIQQQQQQQQYRLTKGNSNDALLC